MQNPSESVFDNAARARFSAAIADRYRLLQPIGAGGMAGVYLADDIRHRRRVALKVLRPELALNVGSARFLREIEVTAQLHHPNILPLLDSGSAEGFVFYVMPYVEGASLRERLASGPIPVGDAVRLLCEVVDALAEAHRRGIVHRDIKPDNVLVSGRHALVADFGVARAVGDAATQPLTTVGIALGTPAYMAPEQSFGDMELDHRVDIYAFGIMAFEVLTGKLPFSGNAQALFAAHSTAPPPSLRALRPDIPVALEAIVLKCLAKDRNDRWSTADELLSALEAQRTPAESAAGPVTARSRPSARMLLGAGVFVAVVVGAIVVQAMPARRALWIRNTVIPAIEAQTDSGNWDAAYRIAKAASVKAPDDSALLGAWGTFSSRVRYESTPSGALVWRRAYRDSLGEWEPLGTTPVSTRVPYDPAVLRIELAGHRSLLVVVDATLGETVRQFTMDSPTVLPEDMVRVDGGEIARLQNLRIAGFFIDRFEVTNADFKTFIDSGGYTRRDFWQPFEREGRPVAWDSAMKLLLDRTGRPGPSGWELGDFPKGQEKYPVSGVSWYEASAYARFRGKSLPTVHHWRRAYANGNAAWTVPASNLDGDGPAPVGQYRGVTRYGAFDMAGNVREWTDNSRGTHRLLIGSGWSDPDWSHANDYPADPFDRSPMNGIRLAKYFEKDSVLAIARAPFREPAPPDFRKIKPASDEAFAVYRGLYAYDHRPLNARVESAETTTHWVRERITIDAAYGVERVPLYLYLPRNGTPPFQTVVYWPGSSSMSQRSIDQWRTIHLDFAIKSGRAFAFPIFKGTFERADGMKDAVDSTAKYRDRVIQLTNDLSRSLDYLSTRREIDSTRFAYYGYSWGARMATIPLVVDPRFKAALLYIAGYGPRRPRPEVDELNFASRVRVPVLVFSGRFNPTFDLETSAKPFFATLGTPAEHKDHVISDGGHFVPRQEHIRKSLDWLDRYLGKVK